MGQAWERRRQAVGQAWERRRQAAGQAWERRRQALGQGGSRGGRDGGGDHGGGDYGCVGGSAGMRPGPTSRRLAAQIKSGKPGGPLEVRGGGAAVAGWGVFAVEGFRAGDFVGPYIGTVMTEEEFEAAQDAQDASLTTEGPPGGDCEEDGGESEEGGDGGRGVDRPRSPAAARALHHCFHLHDGAHAVVLDGERGLATNELKFINHSCSPNAVMREVFCDGYWHVAILALRGIAAGEEICHDYGLTTEDPKDPGLAAECGCGAGDGVCRGKLMELVEF